MEDKEERILESARKVFFRYGFKKTSMDEIAEDAGVGKGTLYNYFKNKPDLFVRVGEHKRDELLEKIRRISKSIIRADEKLIKMVECMIGELHEMVSRYAMSYSVLQELITTGMNLIEHDEQHIEDLKQLLHEGEKQGIFKRGNHHQSATVLTRIHKNSIIRWAQMDLKSAKAEIRDIYELIFNGLYTSDHIPDNRKQSNNGN